MGEITHTDRKEAREQDEEEMKENQRKYPVKHCRDCNKELPWYQIFQLNLAGENLYPLCLDCYNKRKEVRHEIK